MISLIICIETIDICVRGMVRSCRYISIRRVNEMSANYVTRLSLSVLFMNPKINASFINYFSLNRNSNKYFSYFHRHLMCGSQFSKDLNFFQMLFIYFQYPNFIILNLLSTILS